MILHCDDQFQPRFTVFLPFARAYADRCRNKFFLHGEFREKMNVYFSAAHFWIFYADATMFYLRKVSYSAHFNYLFQERGVQYGKTNSTLL
jgi:hypothetical protein